MGCGWSGLLPSIGAFLVAVRESVILIKDTVYVIFNIRIKPTR